MPSTQDSSRSASTPVPVSAVQAAPRRSGVGRLAVGGAFLGGAAFVLACGSGGDFSRSSYKTESSPSGFGERRAHGALVVDPDSGIFEVRITAGGADYSSAADATRTRVQDVAAALASVEGCATEQLDYTPPLANTSGWRGHALVMVTASLSALSVEDRIHRIDACRAPLDAMWHEKDSGISLTPMVLTVLRPQDHLPALLLRAQENLMAADAMTNPSFHPEDRRCVPDGRVHISERLITGVELTTNLNCRIERVDEKPPLEG